MSSQGNSTVSGGCSDAVLDKIMSFASNYLQEVGDVEDLQSQASLTQTFLDLFVEHIALDTSPNVNEDIPDGQVIRDQALLEEIKRLSQSDSPRIHNVLAAYRAAMDALGQQRSMLANRLEIAEGACGTQRARLDKHITVKLIELDREIHQVLVRIHTSFLDTRPRRQNHPPEVVAILQKWFDDHAADPYPTERDKTILAAQCNLEPEQIGNWFSNKRNRTKKN